MTRKAIPVNPASSSDMSLKIGVTLVMKRLAIVTALLCSLGLSADAASHRRLPPIQTFWCLWSVHTATVSSAQRLVCVKLAARLPSLVQDLGIGLVVERMGERQLHARHHYLVVVAVMPSRHYIFITCRQRAVTPIIV